MLLLMDDGGQSNADAEAFENLGVFSGFLSNELIDSSCITRATLRNLLLDERYISFLEVLIKLLLYTRCKQTEQKLLEMEI